MREPRRIADLGPLHSLLLLACPPDEKGKRSIPVLARALGISNEGIYKWIRQERMPSKRARQIVEMSGGRASIDDFFPFIF